MRIPYPKWNPIVTNESEGPNTKIARLEKENAELRQLINSMEKTNQISRDIASGLSITVGDLYFEIEQLKACNQDLSDANFRLHDIERKYMSVIKQNSRFLDVIFKKCTTDEIIDILGMSREFFKQEDK